jgi:hypothetical protein
LISTVVSNLLESRRGIEAGLNRSAEKSCGKLPEVRRKPAARR